MRLLSSLKANGVQLACKNLPTVSSARSSSTRCRGCSSASACTSEVRGRPPCEFATSPRRYPPPPANQTTHRVSLLKTRPPTASVLCKRDHTCRRSSSNETTHRVSPLQTRPHIASVLCKRDHPNRSKSVIARANTNIYYYLSSY